MPIGTNEAPLEALLFPASTPPARFAEPDYFQIPNAKISVGYSAPSVALVDRTPGECRQAQTVVALLAASSRSHWKPIIVGLDRLISAIQKFVGGVPVRLMPDNLQAAVSKAYRYSPMINVTSAEMAAHYQTEVLSARP